jgi:hypothetical protein
MAATLTIPVSDEQWTELQEKARQQHTTPESLVTQHLAGLFANPPTAVNGSPAIPCDPLLRWIGAIEADVPDVGLRHDDYLGEALHEDMNRGAADETVR